jgi:hypothetical protein
MTISLTNAVKNGLPIIEKDLYKKCDRSKYNVKLIQYKHRDADATVYDQGVFSINQNQKNLIPSSLKNSAISTYNCV